MPSGKPYRILVTGSRSWTDRKVIAEAVFKAIDDEGVTPGRDYVVVHGACGQGADALAAEVCADEAWWLDRLGAALIAEPHPADWESCADYCSSAHRKRRWDGVSYCPAAGLRRDAEMVALGASVALAFIAPCTKPACAKRKPHGSHGASHTARIAERRDPHEEVHAVMATSQMIEQACRPDKAPPTSSPYYVEASPVLAMPSLPAAEEQKLRHGAATKLAEMFGQLHDCNAEPAWGGRPARPCTRDGHKADMAACKEALDLLGLLPETPAEEAAQPAEQVRLPAPKRVRRRRLPLAWMNDAACDGEPLVMFFGPDGEQRPERELREDIARSICNPCRALYRCRDHAIANSEKGFWGGMNSDERAAERRRRSRRAAAERTSDVEDLAEEVAS